MMRKVLITGSTDGIGFETARQLLAMGMHVLVHGRSEVKATRQAKALTSHVAGANTTPVWGDLSRMREVAALAEQVRVVAPVLDVLINNAGIYAQRRIITEDGFESTMAVNHFAPYLLTRLVGPLVSKAPAGRIVTVSSMAHQSGDIDLDDLTFE
ncbi:MAG: SDR family NAD(P)-dependent oxidoreductase, partial [Betaproteobacteria bacterium]